nr:hypothetical protein [uncultured bacterium]
MHLLRTPLWAGSEHLWKVTVRLGRSTHSELNGSSVRRRSLGFGEARKKIRAVRGKPFPMWPQPASDLLEHVIELVVLFGLGDIVQMHEGIEQRLANFMGVWMSELDIAVHLPSARDDTGEQRQQSPMRRRRRHGYYADISVQDLQGPPES